MVEVFLDITKSEKELNQATENVKNFVKLIPEENLILFEKKLMEKLLYLIEKENSKEEIEKFANLISFLKNTDIISDFNLKIIKLKIEKLGKLYPALYAYFFISNFNR